MNIGHDNQVAWWKVLSILVVHGSAAQKMRSVARDAGLLVNATAGRRQRSMILMDGGMVILSGVTPETLILRLNQQREKDKIASAVNQAAKGK